MPTARRSRTHPERHKADDLKELVEEVAELKLDDFSCTVIREKVQLTYEARHDNRRIWTAGLLFFFLGAILLYGMITDRDLEKTLSYAAPISALAGAAAAYLFRHGNAPGETNIRHPKDRP